MAEQEAVYNLNLMMLISWIYCFLNELIASAFPSTVLPVKHLHPNEYNWGSET